MQKTKVIYLFEFFVVIILIYIYFNNSAYIVSCVKEALFLCYDTVIPSLFIFIVITIFLSNCNICQFTGIPFLPVFKLLNIHNVRIASYCILSILSGFATGGYFLNKIKENKLCDDNCLNIISILVSNNSPAFVITAVGTNMIGHFSSGVMLYFSLIASSFITAFIFSVLYPYPAVNISENYNGEKTGFISALNSAVTAMISICGIVIFSYALCKVVVLYSNNIYISSLFSAFLEVTTACKMITDNFGNNLYLICICLAVCPLSTYLQLKSYGNSHNINLKILFLSKFIHIPLSLLILKTAVILFPQSFAVYATNDIHVNMYWNSPHISCFFLILSLCFVIFFDKEIGVFTKSVK